MSDGGKGSRPRPFSVSQAEYESRWDAIFSRDGLDDNKTNKNESEVSDNKTETKDSQQGK